MGTATVTTADASAADGNNGEISAVIDHTWALNAAISGLNETPVDSGVITEGNSPSASMNVSVTGSTTLAAAGTTPTFAVQVLNTSGAPTTADTLGWTLTGPTGFAAINDGTVTAGALTAGESEAAYPASLTLAGTYTLTITDASNAFIAPVIKTITVNPAAASAFEILSADGAAAPTAYATANTWVGILVKPIDASGNVSPLNVATTVNLSDTSAGGAFALTSGGTPASSVTIAAGASSVEVYYINSATVGSLTLGTTYNQILTTFAAVATPGSTYDTSYNYYEATVSGTDQLGAGFDTASFTGSNFTVSVKSSSGTVVNYTYAAAAPATPQPTPVFTYSGGVIKLYPANGATMDYTSTITVTYGSFTQSVVG